MLVGVWILRILGILRILNVRFASVWPHATIFNRWFWSWRKCTKFINSGSWQRGDFANFTKRSYSFWGVFCSDRYNSNPVKVLVFVFSLLLAMDSRTWKNAWRSEVQRRVLRSVPTILHVALRSCRVLGWVWLAMKKKGGRERMRKAHTGYQGACKIRHFEEYVKGLGSGRKKKRSTLVGGA